MSIEKEVVSNIYTHCWSYSIFEVVHPECYIDDV